MAVITYYADTGALEDAELFRRFYERSPSERRSKVDEFYFDKDKRLSLGAWTILSYALDEAGCDPRDIVCGEYGKPGLKGSDVQFNISHSGERVLCSVSDGPVGCDVEAIAQIDLKIAENYFFDTEYEQIMECSGDDRYWMFFRYWTLKESFMKAVGLGFHLELDAFKVSIGEEITVDQTVDDRRYHFREYRAGDGYCYAVCSTDDRFSADMDRISLDELA